MNLPGYDAWKTGDYEMRRYTSDEVSELENKLAKAEAYIKRLTEALDIATDYFDQRMDADCDQDGFIPNEEMKIMSAIEEALAKGGY